MIGSSSWHAFTKLILWAEVRSSLVISLFSPRVICTNCGEGSASTQIAALSRAVLVHAVLDPLPQRRPHSGDCSSFCRLTLREGRCTKSLSCNRTSGTISAHTLLLSQTTLSKCKVFSSYNSCGPMISAKLFLDDRADAVALRDCRLGSRARKMYTSKTGSGKVFQFETGRSTAFARMNLYGNDRPGMISFLMTNAAKLRSHGTGSMSGVLESANFGHGLGSLQTQQSMHLHERSWRTEGPVPKQVEGLHRYSRKMAWKSDLFLLASF